MIALRGVSKIYETQAGPHVVLDALDFTFPRGLSVGVVGRNGAGKSTLLRILAGVDLPDEGSVQRYGRISWPIGFSGGFAGQLSAEENCRFVARIYGEDIDRIVGFTQEFAEIGQYFHEPMNTYSQGMRARVAFGLSMAIGFDTYLVDELTAVGDAQFRRKSQRMFAERRSQAAVIMVSHNVGTLRQYCDCCAVLQSGRLRLFDSFEEAKQVYQA